MNDIVREIYSVTVEVPSSWGKTEQNHGTDTIVLTWVLGRKAPFPDKNQGREPLKIVDIIESSGFIEVWVEAEDTQMRQCLYKYNLSSVKAIKYTALV